MSLVLAAKHLESQGRGDDSHLVHMSTGELKALQALANHHGGSLTINPKTGLPEAGFLSSILPTVAGLAGAAFFPAASPWLIAGGVGLATAALTGDLGQGLMAGLGAWGGQSLGSSIIEAGKKAAETGAHLTGEAEYNLMKQKAIEAGGYTTPARDLMLQQGTVGPAIPGSEFANKSLLQPGTFNPALSQSVGNAMSTFGASTGINPPSAGIGDYLSKSFTANPKPFKEGWEAVTNKPMQFIKDNPFPVLSTAYTLANAMSPTQSYKPPSQTSEDNPFGLKRISKDFQGTFPAQPSPAYAAQYRNYVTNPYTTYAASGGLQTANFANRGLVNYGLSLLDNEQTQAPIVPRDPGDVYGGPGVVEYERGSELLTPDQRTEILMKSLFGKKNAIKRVGDLGAISTDPAIVAKKAIQEEKAKAKTENSKEGGLQGYALGGLSVGHLGGYSDGGRLLKGPGDGVSDSIPASIGSKQPARLAEGEFVIPARIVSELGNGSTDAGAKRLYAMMDRIKAKRRKTKDIAADTKTYNYLPA